MKFGSLFSGVGGFDLGLRDAGWECVWQVEKDEHCQQVLKYHWPEASLYGDIQDVKGQDLEPVEAICFGSPCQDLSISGRKAGIDGDNSKMFFEAVRVIGEMRESTRGTFPRWIIWENVIGALSSQNGEDFERVLQEMDLLGAALIEWAVLDAQYFGLPQRRKRVFLIACFDPQEAARCRPQILPVPKGNRRYLAPSGVRNTGDPKYSQGFYGEGIKSALERVTLGCITANIYHRNSVSSQALSQGHVVVQELPNGDTIVRKLTPEECELAMGWPEGYTSHRADRRRNSMERRYQMIGNGVASPVATWVARKVDEATYGL
jgi:DNA (cytosine-5)-methyltransferase 1